MDLRIGRSRRRADPLLARLAELGPESILPNHGDPFVLAGGGYDARLIDATRDYIVRLQRCRDEPYENVHRSNVATVIASTA